MNIAKAYHSDNPISEVLSAVLAPSANDSLVEMASKLRLLALNSAREGKSLDSVERKTWDMVLRIGQQAIELFVQAQGNGDLGSVLVNGQEDQPLLRSDAPVASTIRTVFGTHGFEQFTYNHGPKTKIQLYPISTRMQLPDSEWSNMLQEFSQILCVDQAYNQASENLSAFLGGKYSVDTLEATNQRMGIHAGEFMSNLPVPPKAEEGEILVATLDGKGIPMRKPSTETPQDQQEQEEKASAAISGKQRRKERKSRAKAAQTSKWRAAFEEGLQRPGNRRMATVASVYTVDPFKRTAEQIVAALFRDPQESRRSDQPDRPRPSFKHTTAHLPECYEDGEDMVYTSGIVEAAQWCNRQLKERRRKGQKVIVLLDGQVALLQEMEHFLGDAMLPILDIIHVSSYVWDVGKALYTKREDQLAFVRTRLLEILKGRSSSVVRGIRCMATTKKIKGKKRETMAAIRERYTY